MSAAMSPTMTATMGTTLHDTPSTGAAPADTPPAAPFPYEGPAGLQLPIVQALTRVVDPEVALSIVDLGLVYGVRLREQTAQLRMTMTSPACPVTDVIVDEVEIELDRTLPAGWAIQVELCWEPPWSPHLMSERARRFLQG